MLTSISPANHSPAIVRPLTFNQTASLTINSDGFTFPLYRAERMIGVRNAHKAKLSAMATIKGRIERAGFVVTESVGRNGFYVAKGKAGRDGVTRPTWADRDGFVGMEEAGKIFPK